ncbi:hypothetical protein Y032_0539g3147 [Ancylostoma ceylanicum]|uniref:Uncharacterized protein n=1 Tax=Ancylostoma ceylanicum TaxID=53326 RepID=A0A016WRH9_9BILA|nr:hypothetical protein Y032_0539g3147 [Ancylostoma ceylanicum]
MVPVCLPISVEWRSTRHNAMDHRWPQSPVNTPDRSSPATKKNWYSGTLILLCLKRLVFRMVAGVVPARGRWYKRLNDVLENHQRTSTAN